MNKRLFTFIHKILTITKLPFATFHQTLSRIKHNPYHFAFLLILPSFFLGVKVDSLKSYEILNVSDQAITATSSLIDSSQNVLSTIKESSLSIPLGSTHDFQDPSFYADLPVGNVESFPVSNSKGTVIYIPQFHKLPGSQISDKRNDRAVSTQKEILAIENKLVNHDVNLVMIEGELAGDIQNDGSTQLLEKINSVQKIKELRGILASHLKENPIDTKTDSKVLSSVDKAILSVEREITLKGSAYTLSGQNPHVTLVGAENKETLNQSAELVREHIYLNDRISALGSNVTSNMRLQKTFITESLLSAQEYQMFTSLLKKKSTVTIDLKNLQSRAKEKDNSEIITVVSSLLQEINKLNTLNSQGSIDTQQVTKTTYSNPYTQVTDMNLLKSKLKENEKNIEVTVVDKRNKETASYFVDALNRHDAEVGILQYGAGHKKGLIEELNKQGLSVVVVTPLVVHNAKDL